MVLSKKGKLASRSGEVIVAAVDSYAPVQLNDIKYTQTVRNGLYEVLVNGTKCSHCVAYRATLRKAYHRWSAKRHDSPSRHTSSTSHTNFRYLNTPEKQQRYKNLKARSNAAERKLKETIKKVVQEQGVK